MKKITVILLSTLLVLSLAACGNADQNSRSEVPTEPEVTNMAAEPEDERTESTEEITEDTESTEENADVGEGGG